ncbi:MAG: 2-C-methyl-D-erythritol 4-phosphate cytidylyltransferase [Pyrinomonadaceae bacterium]|nr:2-C-methyl-D-erythritol 4-phosphate cytidylyltransferase [Pyrinomonadaceae bacterium]
MNVAIIVAAGTGSRMGDGERKQFRLLAGKPLVVHTLKRFEECHTIGEMIAVVPAGDVAQCLRLASEHNLGKLTRVVPGGNSRAESVLRGLQAVRAATAEIIAVHDGARPFVSPDEIDRTVRAAQGECGAAILVRSAVDTIKEIEASYVKRTLPRASLRHALTPQCFRYDLLRRAYQQAAPDEATDDSQLVEALGVKVSVVEGDRRNIKITTPEDWKLAEILVREFGE